MIPSIVSDRIVDAGVIAQTNIADVTEAVSAAKSILDGDVSAMTVSIIEENAVEMIGSITRECPEAAIGVSDVTEPQQCEAAIKAGAVFVITLGLDPDIAACCKSHDVLMIPNCVTPAEMLSAYQFGLRLLGFFPADSYGGIDTLEAVSSVLRNVKWIPFNETRVECIDRYASKQYVAAVGCTWLYQKGEEPSRATERCREAIDRMLGFEMFHVGINSDDRRAALATAEQLHKAFRFPVAEGPGAYYVSSHLKQITNELIDPSGKIAETEPGAFYVTADFEVMKKNYRGTNGHLAIRTNSIERAIAYLGKQGYRVDMGTAYRMGERFFTVYLDDPYEFGGFAVHLFQK